jgi:hypothetical protein
MTSRLAIDPIELAHGGNTVRLVPSLWAAFVLQRKHGLARLSGALTNGDLHIIEDIIATGASDAGKARAFMGAVITDRGLKALFSFNDKLSEFLVETFGLDPQGDHKPSRTTEKPKPLEDIFTELFEIGTGWLGWTPAETFAATPAQITAAWRGHVAKLKAIYGGSEEDKPEAGDVYTGEDLKEIDRLGFDPNYDRSAVRSFAAKLNGGFA